jgi:invasion protein IalB
MVQVTRVQGKDLPFSRVVIAQPSKSEPPKMIVQVPVNVSFSAKVRVQTTQSDPGVAAPFARCIPLGCFADFTLNDESVKKLRSASGAGKLLFADASGHEIAVPLSFKGFSQAFDALVKE